MFPFTLYQLRVLKAVATEKNFTKAAKSLYLSQPSLSKQIKTLETNLGVSVLNRKKNSGVLTKSGKLLLVYAERILALCEESCRTLVDSKKGDRGNLIVGVTKSLGVYLFPKIIAFFAQIKPQLTLNIRIYSTKKLISELQCQKIDFAVLNEKFLSKLRSSLIFKPFVYDKIDLVMPKINFLNNVSESNIYSLPYITLTTDSEQNFQIKKVLKKKKIKTNQFNQTFTFDSIEDLKLAVNLGLGVAFVPTLFVKKEVKTKKLKLLNIKNSKIIQKFYLVRNRSHSESKISRFFYKTLLDIHNQIY